MRTPANGFANPLRTAVSLAVTAFERFEPLLATHKRHETPKKKIKLIYKKELY